MGIVDGRRRIVAVAPLTISEDGELRLIAYLNWIPLRCWRTEGFIAPAVSVGGSYDRWCCCVEFGEGQKVRGRVEPRRCPQTLL